MSKIVLQGFLYDEKSSFKKGPALAPPVIREAYHSESSNYFAEDGMEVLTSHFEDMGILPFKIILTLSQLQKNILKKDCRF